MKIRKKRKSKEEKEKTCEKKRICLHNFLKLFTALFFRKIL